MNTERLTEDAKAEKRYASRKAVSLTLTALVDGAERRVTVRDLSHTGFLVDAKPALVLNQTIEIDVPNEGRKMAKVVWAGGAMAGCTFDEPISKASLSASLLQSGFMKAQAGAGPREAEPVGYAAEEYSHSTLPVWGRLAVIGTASVLAWMPILFVGSMLIG